jgi:hypothetical protein
MADYYQPAALKDRALAALLDFGPLLALWAALILLDFLPLLGPILTSGYILFRDGSRGKSLGKHWRHLSVISLENHRPCTWQDSFMRNLFISVPLLGLLMIAVEGVMAIMKDSELRRLGDHFGNTMVIADHSIEK